MSGAKPADEASADAVDDLKAIVRSLFEEEVGYAILASSVGPLVLDFEKLLEVTERLEEEGEFTHGLTVLPIGNKLVQFSLAED